MSSDIYLCRLFYYFSVYRYFSKYYYIFLLLDYIFPRLKNNICEIEWVDIKISHCTDQMACNASIFI